MSLLTSASLGNFPLLSLFLELPSHLVLQDITATKSGTELMLAVTEGPLGKCCHPPMKPGVPLKPANSTAVPAAFTGQHQWRAPHQPGLVLVTDHAPRHSRLQPLSALSTLEIRRPGKECQPGKAAPAPAPSRRPWPLQFSDSRASIGGRGQRDSLFRPVFSLNTHLSYLLLFPLQRSPTVFLEHYFSFPSYLSTKCHLIKTILPKEKAVTVKSDGLSACTVRQNRGAGLDPRRPPTPPPTQHKTRGKKSL